MGCSNSSGKITSATSLRRSAFLENVFRPTVKMSWIIHTYGEDKLQEKREVEKDPNSKLTNYEN